MPGLPLQQIQQVPVLLLVLTSWGYQHGPSAAGSRPEVEKSLRRRADVAAARKLRPAATATTFSPSGMARDHSPLGAQLSRGRNTTMLGASALDLLAYSGPCRGVAWLRTSTTGWCYREQPLPMLQAASLLPRRCKAVAAPRTRAQGTSIIHRHSPPDMADTRSSAPAHARPCRAAPQDSRTSWV